MYAIFYPTTSMYFKLFSSKSQTSNPRVVPSHTTCSCQAKTDVRDVKWPPVDLQHFLTVKKNKAPLACRQNNSWKKKWNFSHLLENRFVGGNLRVGNFFFRQRKRMKKILSFYIRWRRTFRMMGRQFRNKS